MRSDAHDSICLLRQLERSLALAQQAADKARRDMDAMSAIEVRGGGSSCMCGEGGATWRVACEGKATHGPMGIWTPWIRAPVDYLSPLAVPLANFLASNLTLILCSPPQCV